MAAAVLEAKVWERLLEAWRKEPGNITEAARQAGCSIPTARKAIKVGYPHVDPPRRPIADIVREEQKAARAAMQGTIEDEARRAAMEDAARARREAEKARQDAVEARRQEATMVRSQRGNVLALIAITGTAIRGAVKLAKSVETDLERGMDGDKPMKLNAKMAALSRLALVTQRIASAAGDVVKMERLLLGEPTEILAHRHVSDVDFDEALKELEQSAETAKRIRERKERKEAFKLRVVNGGRS